MIKKAKRLLIFVLFSLTIPLVSSAQETNTMYFMPRLPQMSFMNPAFQPECNFYLSLPGVSEVNLNLGNNSLTYNDVIFDSPVNDSLITFLHPQADPSNFLSQLNPSNDLFTEFSTNIFGFGFRAGPGYFTFHVKERSELNFSYPKDFMTFLLEGNQQMQGQTMDFNHFNLFTNHHLEYSLGYAGKVGDKLGFGVRLKYLNGLANLQSEEFDLQMYTSASGDSLALNTNIDMRGSVPVEVATDSLGFIEEVSDPFHSIPEEGEPPEETEPTLSDLFANPGIALDFGVSYQLTDQLEISASVTDLGFINYNKDVHNYTIHGEDIAFTGVDVSSEFDDGENNFDPAQQMADSLKEQIQFSYAENQFLHFLGPRIYVGGNYSLSDRVDLGLVSRTRFFGGEVKQSFTLSANTRPIRGVSFSASYSVMNRAYNNLGLGLGLRLGPFQVYTVSDVLSAGLWPENTRAFNLRFGLNFVFGCNREKRLLDDQPMIR
ncbi:MAG: hypothetical protein KGY60_06785 [Bacteroidales bacterium]|nr:hypothetical protein [Bacteroidales bacterium]